jgi:large subunit ribosomal protein L25
MEIANVKGEPRSKGGHHANERLRSRGLLPAVIYGHGQPPELVALSAHDTGLALRASMHVINVQIDGGGERQYLIKDVQYDHLQQDPVHVDLMRVDVNERVEVKVRVVLRGMPRGVVEGGNLMQLMPDVLIECLVLGIPEEIRVHVEHLGLNENLLARDLPLPPDVKLLADEEDVVAIVHPPRVEEEVEEEAAAEGEAEPEIIGRAKEEEAGAGEGGE